MCTRTSIFGGLLIAFSVFTVACPGGGGGGGGTPPTATPKKIIFSSQASGMRDLFMIEQDGTGLVTLASSTFDEWYGGIAGKRILFYRQAGSSDIQLHSVLPDGSGSAFLASNVYGTDVMPDTTVIVSCMSTTGRNLYRVNADGTGPAQITSGAFVLDQAKGFTSDNRIVFGRYPASSGQQDLYIMNADGTGIISLATSTFSEEFAALTPDNRVLFSRDMGSGEPDLFVVNSDGTNLLSLATSTYPDWFQTLVGNASAVYMRTVGAQTDLYLVSFGTGTPVTTPLATTLHQEFFKKLTTDNRVIFQSRLTPADPYDLKIVKADGTGLVSLASTTYDEEFAGLTSDNRVVFNRHDGTQNDLYIVNADGTGLVPLAVTAYDESFSALTPDNRIIFSRAEGSQSNLYIINPNGTGLTPLTTGAGYKWFLALSPEGRVLFARDTYNIYSVKLDGTDLIPVATSTGTEIFNTFY